MKEHFEKTTFSFSPLKLGKEIKFEFKHTAPDKIIGFRKNCSCISAIDFSKEGVISGTLKPEPNIHEIKAVGGKGDCPYSRSFTMLFDDGLPTEIPSDKPENKGEMIKNPEKASQLLIVTGAVTLG